MDLCLQRSVPAFAIAFYKQGKPAFNSQCKFKKFLRICNNNNEKNILIIKKKIVIVQTTPTGSMVRGLRVYGKKEIYGVCGTIARQLGKQAQLNPLRPCCQLQARIHAQSFNRRSAHGSSTL